MILSVSREMVSKFLPRKLLPLNLKTIASLKMRSNAHSKASDSSKLSFHNAGTLLLVKIILKELSLLYLLSIRSKNGRVFSLSNTQCPISSITRHEGLPARLVQILVAEVVALHSESEGGIARWIEKNRRN